jgi:ADP-heptose:LPS heptosyltransferase
VNRESLVYVGDRPGVGKEWKQRRYIFNYGQPVMVPDDFAKVLLKSGHFAREDELKRTVLANHPGGGTVLFRRWGAMGDLLMFRAAVSAFVRAHPEFNVALRCQERFVSLFTEDPLWAGIVPISSAAVTSFKSDGVAIFDQVAEVDHRGVKLHRCELFLKAMTHEKITITREDWLLPIPEAVGEWVHRHLAVRALLPHTRRKKLVAVQVRGSATLKTLPEAVMVQLISGLLERGNDVILIESDRKVAEKFVLSDRVHTMTDRDALHGIAMLAYVDLAITMDSGALWMAHCAPARVLAILGPTRPEERITMHPDYPHGARAVKLNDIINCPACFEGAQKCAQKYTCMRNQPDWGVALNKIFDEASSMLAGDVRLPVAASNPA